MVLIESGNKAVKVFFLSCQHITQKQEDIYLFTIETKA